MEPKPTGPEESIPAEPERGPADVELDVETTVGGQSRVVYSAIDVADEKPFEPN